MRKLQLLTMAVFLAGAPAAAQDRAPDWVKTPSARDIASVWPSVALKEGIGGKAIIACIVTVQGTLRACRIDSESPAGKGFGGAALVLSSQFLLKPALKNGAPVEAGVRIPIDFPRPDAQTGSYLRPSSDGDFRGDTIWSGLAWKAAPTAAEVLAAYPAKAREKKAGGTVTLDCRIGKDGHLEVCRPMKESPGNLGFGAAAKSLGARFVAPTVNDKGVTIAGDHAAVKVTFAETSLDAQQPGIGHPEWRALPTLSDMAAIIPAAARKAQVFRARVVMVCVVAADGGLQDCKSESEEPSGLGYADAALSLSRYFRLAIWTEEGLPVIGGVVRVPLRFDLGAGPAPAAPPGAPAS